MSQEVEKVHNFFDRPPSLRMIWTLLNLGKIGNWEKFELWDPPWKIKHKLKTIKSITLKLTCFLFNRGIYSLHLNLGKTWKFGLPPSYRKVYILNFVLKVGVQLLFRLIAKVEVVDEHMLLLFKNKFSQLSLDQSHYLSGWV